MTRFLNLLVKEIAGALLLVIGVTAFLFAVFNLMAGSFPGKGGGAAAYFELLKRLVSFRFGTSVVSGRDIGALVFPAFRNTLVLTSGAVVLSVFVSVPIGIFSSSRGFRGYSWPLVIFSYVMSCIPVFYLGYLSLYLVSRFSGLLPIYYSMGPHSGGNGREAPFLTRALPILVLGLGNDSISEIVRLISIELGRVTGSDYALAAKARGESVLLASVSEGIFIPLVSIVFSKVPFLIGGAVIVEHVFNWPGMGRLAFQSTLDRDLPVLIVIAFLSVLLVRAGMLLKECILFYFRPRE
jgi:peptide/nickel transport system permease protein